MDKRSKVDQAYLCWKHVDDLSFVLVAETDSELRALFSQAGRLVGSEVKRLHLQLSEINHPSHSPGNQNGCDDVDGRRHSHKLSTGADVGIRMLGGLTRRASIQNKRIEEKGAKRAERTRTLVEINPLAVKLTMTVVHPTQSYGHQTLGAAISQMLAMRKYTKGPAAFIGSWACSAIVMAWIPGPTADPLVR